MAKRPGGAMVQGAEATRSQLIPRFGHEHKIEGWATWPPKCHAKS
jgi:hypothetical protein